MNMNKNALIAILGAAVVALLAVVCFQFGKESGGSGGGQPPSRPHGVETTHQTAPTEAGIVPDSPGNPVADSGSSKEPPDGIVVAPPSKPDTLPIAVTNTLPAVKQSDIDRLPRDDEPQDITSIFEAKARGTYAKWGGAADADIYYLLKLVATSTVESKEDFGSGKIRVEEIRSFHEATEIIKPAKVNLRVDLRTVPLDQIELTGYLLGGIVSVLGAPDTGLAIADCVRDLRMQVDSLDGLEGRPVVELLQQFGIDIEKVVNEPVEEYLNGLLDDVHSHVNAVQGKSYRFVYWTDQEGEPLRVRYENVDGSPLSLEEQNVLNYVNLFIDCHLLPDKNCRPGDCWNVGASAVAAMFGAVADGTCSGDVTVTRGNDLPDGNWDLTISPATVTLYSDDRRPIGNVKVNGGKAVGDARKVVLRELQLDGKGKLRKHDKETKLWFYDFVTKIDGDCEFRSTLLPRRED